MTPVESLSVVYSEANWVNKTHRDLTSSVHLNKEGIGYLMDILQSSRPAVLFLWIRRHMYNDKLLSPKAFVSLYSAQQFVTLLCCEYLRQEFRNGRKRSVIGCIWKAAVRQSMSNMPLVVMLCFVILRHTRRPMLIMGGKLAGFRSSIGSCSDIFIGTDFQLPVVVQRLNGWETAFEGLSFSLIDQFNHARGVQTARDIQWINEKTHVSFCVFQRNRR